MAAGVKFLYRNAKLFRLVGQVGRDARTWKDYDADRQHVQQLIISFERRGFGVAGPVMLEGHLWHLAADGLTTAALHAAVAKFPHRNSQFFGLVGQVGRDTGTWK